MESRKKNFKKYTFSGRQDDMEALLSFVTDEVSRDSLIRQAISNHLKGLKPTKNHKIPNHINR